jgi:hypothetical protein
MISLLLRIPQFRKEFASRIVKVIIAPHREVVEGAT